ncbi:hypothetical protein L6304_02070 [bacterium]|nr:hypothetical protein [bacterium]
MKIAERSEDILEVKDMRWFLFLMAGIWTIAGIFLLVAAAKAKKLYNRLLKGKNLKTISFIPLIVGILLVYSASSSDLPWFVNTIGLLALAKGLFFIFASEKKAKPFVDWWLKASLGIYRLGGLVAIALGIFFFCRVA